MNNHKYRGNKTYRMFPYIAVVSFIVFSWNLFGSVQTAPAFIRRMRTMEAENQLPIEFAWKNS